MKSNIEKYVMHVIRPLDNFRKKLTKEYSHISGSRELSEEIENDLFTKYLKLEKIIDEEK